MTEIQTSTSDKRKAELARAVQKEVARGGRVESQSDYDAIIRFGKTTNHTFHLLMSLFTLSVWFWLVWPWVAIVHAIGRKTVSLTVDDYGNILRQKL